MNETTRTTRIPTWAPYALLFSAVFLMFGDVISYPYVWDDFLLIEMSVDEALQIPPERVHVRPVWYLSHVVSSAIVQAPWFDHLVNLLLFAASILLAFHYARGQTTETRAAIAVGLWILVPWNVYPVAWVAQRNDLLIYVFVFLALLALRRERFGLALVATSLAIFSKITAAFVPLYVAWKLKVAGKRLLAIAMLFVFAIYLALAMHSYLRFRVVGEHLADVAPFLAMLRFPAHWAEHIVLLVVPAPFFTGWLHAGVYGVFLSAAIAGARVSRGRWRDPEGLEILAIALLLSIPTIVTPHLRICGLETFFWLLFLSRAVSFGNRSLGAIAVGALVAWSIWGVLATKEIFRVHALPNDRGEHVSLYPNPYYEWRAEVARDLARSLR